MSYPTRQRFNDVARAGTLRQGDEIYTGSGKVKRVLATHCPAHHSLIRILVEGENEPHSLSINEPLMVRRLFEHRFGQWRPA